MTGTKEGQKVELQSCYRGWFRQWRVGVHVTVHILHTCVKDCIISINNTNQTHSKPYCRKQTSHKVARKLCYGWTPQIQTTVLCSWEILSSGMVIVYLHYDQNTTKITWKIFWNGSIAVLIVYGTVYISWYILG